MNTKPSPATDDLEREVDEAIAVCGGDMRETIRGLLVANNFLEARLERMKAVVSVGYARGKIGKH
jgi:hypothetical protein